MPAPITKNDYNQYLKLMSLSNEPLMSFEQYVVAMDKESDRPLHHFKMAVSNNPAAVPDLRSTKAAISTGANPQAVEYLKNLNAPKEAKKETPAELFERYKKEWWAAICDTVATTTPPTVSKITGDVTPARPVLTANQRKAIAYIIAWFARLPQFDYTDKETGSTSQITVDLTKGLWLCGKSGVGKTTTIEIMQKVTKAFALVAMRSLAVECLNAGNLTPVTDRINNKLYCLDDVGSEPRVKVFGNDIEVFSEVVMLYEQQNRQSGLPLIATSNILPVLPNGDLNPAFASRYGEREANRVKHLFKIVYLDGEGNW
jgi:hypothetical protein